MATYQDYPGLKSVSNYNMSVPLSMLEAKNRCSESKSSYSHAVDMNEYMRNTLKDFRPDPAMFAHEESRHNNGSLQRLNLLYEGSHSGAEPYLPDGTFLDHEFLNRDPRGIALGPDMQKYRDNNIHRLNNVNFYYDGANDTPESRISPEKMISIRKHAANDFGRRFNNFDESMNNWHNGGTANRHKRTNAVTEATLDGTILDLTEASGRNRTDHVSKLSNDPTVSFRSSTSDHRVKVGRELATKKLANYNVAKYAESKYQSDLDHTEGLSSESINRGLVMGIIDFMNQKKQGKESFIGTLFSRNVRTN